MLFFQNISLGYIKFFLNEREQEKATVSAIEYSGFNNYLDALFNFIPKVKIS